MNRNQWEKAFIKLLAQHLSIGPQQVRFTWKQYFNQRYSPEQAIAHLIETHRLYPQLGILPHTQLPETISCKPTPL